MTAIAADFENVFAQSPPLRRAFEALSAIAAQYGRSRMVAWARAAEDDATRIMAVMLENATLAIALLNDLDRAHRSGNPSKLAKVRRRFDRVLDMIETRHNGARFPQRTAIPSEPEHAARRCETTNELESRHNEPVSALARCRHCSSLRLSRRRRWPELGCIP